jgi:hypothetical protein
MYTLATDLIRYHSAVSLTRFLSRRTMSVLRAFSFALMVACAGVYGIGQFIALGTYTQAALGGALIAAGIWLDLLLAYAYHNSYYFYGLNSNQYDSTC